MATRVEDSGVAPMRAQTKRQIDDSTPRKITGLRFGILNPQDIINQGVLEVFERNLYDTSNGSGSHRPPQKHGPLDTRMGVSSGGQKCKTCDKENKDCNGHFGYVKLALPVFHIGFFKKIVEVLHSICKDCGRLLLDEKSHGPHLRVLRRPNLDLQVRKDRVRKVMTECRKVRNCPYCNSVNGTVKKVSGQALKLVHDKFRYYNASSAKKKVMPVSKMVFDLSFDAAKKANPELEKHVRKAMDDLNALKVLSLFRKITDVDCELLGMDPRRYRPEHMIWTYVPAPPVPIRPSVQQDTASTEDDISAKLSDIVYVSSLISAGLQKGLQLATIMEQWDFLHVQVAMYINSEVPNLQQPGAGKAMRGFCQRLKGKQGRFRGNLSGKRVDFSGRTVISPDPNLSIDEVAVPRKVAENLTYPEAVTPHNIEKLRSNIRNGTNWPGASSVVKPGGVTIIMKLVQRRTKGQFTLDTVAKNLRVGDIVHRHLIDGDIVLFNRQPSLHKLSIMSHRVKVREWRTFRLNECVCNPYNADFDGDEMNLHVPQTEEARAEALELMGVKYNLATPKDGTPIIAATQDFLTAAYLLSAKDRFYDKKQFCQIISFMFNAMPAQEPVREGYHGRLGDGTAFLNIEIPEPAICKPRMMWTGKQVFNVLMRPNKDSEVQLNFDAAGKNFKESTQIPNDLHDADSWVVVRNSEIMCGLMDKNILGSGRKDSVFYVMMRDYGPDVAVRGMNRLAKLSARWLSNEGFSIGISDVYPGKQLVLEKQELVRKAYAACDDIIKKYKDGKLVNLPGCDALSTMESSISGILSTVRQEAGESCFKELSKWNSAIIMAKSGSKGSNINVSQMVAAVGQQIIGDKRVADGFQDRSLPHFPKSAPQPPSKGFVSNSFFSGLTPTEFIFHAMSGREGLVDTAVKTAETGYMSRRLMKSLEDLSAQYDSSVRNSTNAIVQFQYGEDGLDPADMEGKAKPVNFERVWTHAQTSTWSKKDKPLSPALIRAYLRKLLEDNRSTDLSIMKEDMEAMDAFVEDVIEFVDAKAARLETLQHRLSHKSDLRTNIRPGPLRDDMMKVSQPGLANFAQICLHKFSTSKVQPGHAVGAIGAQSIGEPGTQMTLKTFHFAGVAGMSITGGVPRIKEIINASKVISTPLIRCTLQNPESEFAARAVKGTIEKTYLKDIITDIRTIWAGAYCKIVVNVSREAISELGLELSLRQIRIAIGKAKGLKIEPYAITYGDDSVTITIRDGRPIKGSKTKPKPGEGDDIYTYVQYIRRILPDVAVSGHPDAHRVLVVKDDKAGAKTMAVWVEGYGLKRCMATPGLVGEKCYTNNVDEMNKVLGIEAARGSIIHEINEVMGKQMGIDPRHMQLLADVMTFKGQVLGITRFGLAKMRDSVLQLASFEKTPDHLFDAAINGKVDLIEGVSECIIMGQSMRIGTGAMHLMRPMFWKSFEKPSLYFADTCRRQDQRMMAKNNKRAKKRKAPRAAA